MFKNKTTRIAGKRAIWVNISLLVSALIIGFILVEMIASYYVKGTMLNQKIEYIEDRLNRYHRPSIGAPDAILGWGYQSGAKDCLQTSEFDICYSINSKGLRDREVDFKKKEGVFRIVAVGESNVFGESINYGRRFTDIIEEAIANSEVVNMGVQGFGMDQSFLYLERDGFKYNPDLVIMFVIWDFVERCKYSKRGRDQFKPRFVLNYGKNRLILQDADFIKNRFRDTYAEGVEPQAVSDAEASGRKGPDGGLLRKSSIYTIIEYYKIRQNTGQRLKDADRVFWNGIYKDLATDVGPRQEYAQEDFKRLIFLLLSRYASACKKHGVDLLVVYIDSSPPVYLKDFCDKLGIMYLDLSGILTRASKFKSLKFAIDPHYNEFAHKIIGEYTAYYIKEKYNLETGKNYRFEFLNKF